MRKKILTIGVISKAEYIKRTIAIAKGEYKVKKDEPKVWFESMQSMAQVLSAENQTLLKLIVDNKPTSLTELERISRRSKSNLSRTLTTLEKYQIVQLPKAKNGAISPVVMATDFTIKVGIENSYV